MLRFLFITSLLAMGIIVNAQTYIGAGNNNQIKTYSSSEYQHPNWTKPATAENTINAVGLDNKIMEASRFLSQATLGFDNSHIEDVVAQGIEGWVDNQMQLATTEILPKTMAVWQQVTDSITVNDPSQLNEDEFRPRWNDFDYAWWDLMMHNEDLLRHRVAVALSEIFVISIKSELSNFGDGLADYYDMLSKNAFGNFENLLRDVSLHPCMGEYLSHYQNQKADAVNNIHPDENYAREVMQLFSIGLYELNPNGSRMLDEAGNFIPTYGQPDIKEFAKIFTGLSAADTIPNPYGDNELNFWRGTWTADVTKPMKMYEDFHEPGQKRLLKGTVVPAGQTGLQDIDDAINNLFNHPNVGPFIGYRLIQRLVKSNPSPAYINRVTQVFNNNGNGVRGDMAAVIKAILLDGEARACSFLQNENNSRLKEPLIRFTHFARAVNKYNPHDYYWHVNWNFQNDAGQGLFASPSVFNFYLPNHSPIGNIADAGLVAPEYNLHNTRTGPGYLNMVHSWTSEWGRIMQTWEDWGRWQFINEEDHDNGLTEVKFDIAYYKELAKDPTAFINELDRVFTHGTLSDHTKNVLKNTMDQLETNQWYDYQEYRVYLAMYILLISPDYAVMR